MLFQYLIVSYPHHLSYKILGSGRSTMALFASLLNMSSEGRQ
jgi:hypothetical protein